jgi:NADH-quinone oxidoreductase subunit L
MENLAQLAPLIILIPSIGAFINFFWGARMGETGAALVGSIASALTFVVALLLLLYLVNNNYEAVVINPPLLDSWIRIDSIGLDITWQTRVDTLSVTMMLFVTFVGTLIHIYAAGYMHGDPRFGRFFAYLNMFLAFMLILVTGNNFLMMFVGWEGVGLCSYLLIGFWWDKPRGEGWKNGNAARKAFIVNRIGDLGMLMAIFMIFVTFGTLDFWKPGEINNVAAREAADAELAVETLAYDNPEVEMGQLGVFGQTQRLLDEQTATGAEHQVGLGSLNLSLETTLVVITLFLLLGAAGKSAQIPLFVWLPDAMAGPTPVSALIHAATMVTAGVYMMVRSNVFFANAELTSFVVTLVGAATALVAGFIAIAQFDIKRVLAYSTISQLGFMVAAVGIGAYPAAIFHMITHAFFKALLFLGSGSVIHGVEHGHHHVEHGHGHHGSSAAMQREDVHGYGEETYGDHKPEVSPEGPEEEVFDPQDMRNMGGLSQKMPVTYWTYLIGTLALAGIYPFAGFWSKDEILADSWLVGFVDGQLAGYLALGLLLVAAGFTAFYMWRQIEMVFHGQPRTEAAEHAHESPPSMTVPLIVLAFFSLFIGFMNIPSGVASLFTLGLDGVFGRHLLGDFLEFSIAKFHLPDFQALIALLALAIGLSAIFFARSIYGYGRAINRSGQDPLEANPSTGSIWGLAHGRLYWDEIYFRLFENPFNRIAVFLSETIDWAFWHNYFHDVILGRGFRSIARLLGRSFDLGIIDGAVNGIGWVTRQISGRMRHLQTGYVRTYAVALLLGVVAVIIIMLLPLIQIG